MKPCWRRTGPRQAKLRGNSKAWRAQQFESGELASGPMANDKRPLLSISPKIGAHDGTIILSQAANQFLAKVVGAGGCGIAVPLLESAAALLDVFLQPVVEIFVLAAFGDFYLIVQLDFIDQQPGEALCLAVDVGIFGREIGKWICRR